MRNSRGNHFVESPSRDARRPNTSRAFTLIELVVVLGILAVFSATLLPALCGTKPQTKVIACAANFRQWAVAANLYAKDNLEWLPSFDPAGGGKYVWDAGTNLCNALGSYGLTVPNWFCPMRPSELDSANAWAQSQYAYGHPISSIDELRRYLSRNYPQELVLNHNYWVPRKQDAVWFPTDYSGVNPGLVPAWVKGTDPQLYGWPRKLNDRAAARVPFISDKCASGNISTNTDDISTSTAHFVNGKLIGVNAAFADGRVEARSKSQMRAVYFDDANYWFY